MLIVHTAQLEAFGSIMRQRYVDRLMQVFSTTWPQKTQGPAFEYRQFIDSSVSRALSYGINTESSVARFVNLCFVWGANFEAMPEHRWALRISADSSLSGPDKVDQLVSRTKAELEKQAAGRGGSRGK